MSIEQIIVLAVVQGLTEFLPISSSGHLILIPAFTGWPDQGIVTDVMVHVGSLFAILAYFWRDVIRLVTGMFDLVRLRMNVNSRLALYIILATIPAVAFGLYLKSSGMQVVFRGVEIIAWNAIIFGILLYIADRTGSRTKFMSNMTLSPALVIGVAQAIALIPGTSRSGITITAARFMGFERAESARFSFLLGIPAIAGAGVLVFGEALNSGQAISSDAILAAVLTFFAALAAIAILYQRNLILTHMMAQIRLPARRVSKGDAGRDTTMFGERIWATEGRVSKGFGRCCDWLVVPVPSHQSRLAKTPGNAGHMSQY